MRQLFVTALTLIGLSNAGATQGSGPIASKQDVIYGRVEGSALLADITYPQGVDRLPAIVSVHGGRWRAGNRTDASSIKVSQWAEFGFFAMSIDYRLVGGSPAPAPYQDVLCAIRWVHAHAAEYHVDPNRIYLIGQSAGGHMVSLVATLGEGPYKRVGGWDTDRDDTRAVISVAGAYDLNTLSWGNLWTPPNEDVEAARRLASPLAHVTSLPEFSVPAVSIRRATLSPSPSTAGPAAGQRCRRGHRRPRSSSAGDVGRGTGDQRSGGRSDHDQRQGGGAGHGPGRSRSRRTDHGPGPRVSAARAVGVWPRTGTWRRPSAGAAE
jgi:hypothetical protein